MRRFLLLAAVLTTVMIGAKGKPPPGELPPKLQGVVDKVEAAYFAGEIEAVWRALAPAVAGLKDDSRRSSTTRCPRSRCRRRGNCWFKRASSS